MFPPEVKEKALVASGRRCCLCHKFAGVGIECHHMRPRAKGGQDTFENCIPLCFDCHAEVGHYSDDHPKGTKFTEAELRGHRDHWYAAYSSGLSPSATSGYEDMDKKLYLTLLNALGGSLKMRHFRDHDYSNGFDVQVEYRLWKFQDIIELPESEFFDTQVASACADLSSAIRKYYEDAATRLWHDGDRANIPPEWAHGTDKQADRFDDAVKVMNQASTKIWNAFSQFVKIARLRLRIEHEQREKA